MFATETRRSYMQWHFGLFMLWMLIMLVWFLCCMLNICFACCSIRLDFTILPTCVFWSLCAHIVNFFYKTCQRVPFYMQSNSSHPPRLFEIFLFLFQLLHFSAYCWCELRAGMLFSLFLCQIFFPISLTPSFNHLFTPLHR